MQSDLSKENKRAEKKEDTPLLTRKEDNIGRYSVSRLPKHREYLSDLQRMSTKHPIEVLAEFDVTDARRLLLEYKVRSGETISFTAWLIKCIAQAVSEDRNVQAYRKGKQLVVFEDVDVAFVMDIASESAHIVGNAVVRKANQKSLKAIHNEIRLGQTEKPIHGTAVGEGEQARLVGRMQSLPAFLRRLSASWYMRNPEIRKRNQGTVGITSVGNILGTSTGMWGCPLVTSMFPLMFAVSGITRKPGIVGDKIVPREFLSMSISLDHDAVDGVEAARFLKRLGELFTTAYGIGTLKLSA